MISSQIQIIKLRTPSELFTVPKGAAASRLRSPDLEDVLLSQLYSVSGQYQQHLHDKEQLFLTHSAWKMAKKSIKLKQIVEVQTVW